MNLRNIVVSYLAITLATSLFADNENYSGQDLTGQKFGGRSLVSANFTASILTNASFWSATLTNANFTNAIITGTRFEDTTSYGFTKEQLYSTTSYKNKDLRGLNLKSNNLTDWDFSGQNLTNASFWSATLTNANFTDAVITGAWFTSTTSRGFTKEQLYSTSSYKNKNLSGVALNDNDLTGWDFSGQNLTGASLSGAALTDANFTDAVIKGASFYNTNSFTKEQLYSTSSYKNKDLSGVVFDRRTLRGWDFSGQNLTDASFERVFFEDVNFTDAVIKGASFYDNTNGFTKELLYSTASYKNKDLSGVYFGSNNLTGWDFSGQNLTSANFGSATLTDTDFTKADLRGATLVEGIPILKNTIWTGGGIKNFSMTSSEDSFSIRKYIPFRSGSGDVPALIRESSTISNSTLTLEAGAKLEVENKATLTLGENAVIVFEITNADTDTNLKIINDSAFDIGQGVLQINFVGEFQEDSAFAILTWDDGATISEEAFMKNKNILVRHNGATLTNWDLRISGNALEISNVPEPSTYATLFGALAIAFAAYRRKRN